MMYMLLVQVTQTMAQSFTISSESLLKAIDAGLAIKPGDRPQDIAQFKRLHDSCRTRHTRIRRLTEASSR
jgi:hypothetical protein